VPRHQAMGCCLVKCMGSICCGACKACGTGCSKVSPTAGYSTRLPYLLFMFVGIIVAEILKIWGSKKLLDLYFWSYQVCNTEACAGNQALLRMSLPLALFFLTFFFFMFSEKSASIHHSCWPGKVIYFLGLAVCSYLLSPDSVFTVYAHIAQFGGAIFMLLQILLLIDMAYRWNASWVEKEKKVFLFLIIFISLAILITSIVFWVLMFLDFNHGSACGVEQFNIVFLIILSMASLLLSISGYIDHGALLPACVVVGYGTFLVYTGLKSDPSTCNKLAALANSTSVTSIVIGIAIAGVSVVYSSWSLSSSSGTLFGQQEETEERVNYYGEENAAVKSDELPPETEEEEVVLTPEVIKTNRQFHLIMFFASLYMGMLLTGWSTNVTDSAGSVFAVSKESMWVNVATGWAVFLLYIWTLMAPKCLPGREFN